MASYWQSQLLAGRLRAIHPTLVGYIFVYEWHFRDSFFWLSNKVCINYISRVVFLFDFLLDRFFVWPIWLFVLKSRMNRKRAKGIKFCLSLTPNQSQNMIHQNCFEATISWCKGRFLILTHTHSITPYPHSPRDFCGHLRHFQIIFLLLTWIFSPCFFQLIGFMLNFARVVAIFNSFFSTLEFLLFSSSLIKQDFFLNFNLK